MTYKAFKPPQLSRPGLPGPARVPRTWDECIQKGLTIALIEQRRISRERRDPWIRKIRSLLIGWRYGQRISRVPPKRLVKTAPPKDWHECIRRQKQKLKAQRSVARQMPWERTIRRKIISLCIRSRVSEWRIPMNVTQRELREQLERQGHRCDLTGRPLTPETATIDHSVPVNRGGRHEIDNLRFVHIDANRAKGTLTIEEFVALCAEVVRHHQSRVPAEVNRPLPRTWDEWAERQIEGIHVQTQKEHAHG